MKYQIGTKLVNRQGKELVVTGFEDRFVVMKHENGKQYMRFPEDVDKYYKIVAQPVEEQSNLKNSTKKNNRTKIEKRCAKHNFKIGCYDNKLEQLSDYSLRKVLENIQYSTDTKVSINRKPYIVEIDEVDGEIDFSVTALKEYENRFGKWED